MDPRLRDAVTSRNVSSFRRLVKEDPKIVLGTTPQGNTALHLSVNLKLEDFTKELCASCPPLVLAMANQSEETPLHCAAMSGHLRITKLLIDEVKSSPPPLRWDEKTKKWVESPILRMTKWNGDTCLHEALRNRHAGVAKELWEADPEQSHLVNKNGESVIYLAVLRKLPKMVNYFLDNPSTPHSGPEEDTALHAAIAVEDLVTARLLLDKKPWLINEPNRYGNTPLHYVALMNKLGFVQLLLDRQASAQLLNSDGFSPVHIAAGLGHVRIVQRLVQHSPDCGDILSEPEKTTRLGANWDASGSEVTEKPAPSSSSKGFGQSWSSRDINTTPSGPGEMAPQSTQVPEEGSEKAPSASKQSLSEVPKNVLHIAIECGKLKVVQYILKAPELRGIINRPDGDGNLPLHLAALKCNSKIIRVLLNDNRTERTALNRDRQTALQLFYSRVQPTVSKQWDETFLLLTDAIPNDNSLVKRHEAQTKLMEKVSGEMRSLARAYANNTTIVSVLMATVTFAAAFTVPGGYISDSGSQRGLPILLGKTAFKLFLITNSVALCTSLAVSFLYISASKGDVEFFLYYRESTRWLMWIAFVAMAMAFASGMYTIVAPGCLWLAIIICVLCGCLPVLTGVLYKWPGSIHIWQQKGTPLDLAQML